MIVRLSLPRAIYASFDHMTYWIENGLFRAEPEEVVMVFPAVSTSTRHKLDHDGSPTTWYLCFVRGCFGWIGVGTGEIAWTSIDEHSKFE